MPDDLNYAVTKVEWQLLQQAQFTCACCGLRSQPSEQVHHGYMEVVRGNESHHVMCAFCSTSLRLNRSVGGRDHGIVLYLPESTQGHVSRLAQFCHGAINEGLPHAKACDRLLKQYKDAQVTPELFRFVRSLGSIHDVVATLEEVERSGKAKLFQLFHGLRYLPSRTHYAHILSYWYEVNPEAFTFPEITLNPISEASPS